MPFTPDQLKIISGGSSPTGPSSIPHNTAMSPNDLNSYFDNVAKQNEVSAPEAPRDWGINSDIQNRADNINTELNNTQQNPIVSGFKAAAQGAGAVTDVAGDIAKPFLSKAADTADTIFGGNPIYDGVKKAIGMGVDNIKKVGSGIADSDTFGKVAEKLNEIMNKHPEATKLVEDTLNILKSGGDVSNVILGAEGASQGLSKVGDVSAQVGSDLTKAASEGVSNVVDKVSNIAKDKGLEKTINQLQSTGDTMSKTERLSAENQLGRVEIGSGGTKKFLPTETEKRAGEIMNGKLGSNPVENVTAIKNEISTRGQDAEKYLADNAVPISNAEHAKMFADARAESEKYLTETELKAYDEQVKIFSKQLPGRGSYDTDTYYKSLKDYEDNVADKLPKGKDALIDPTGVANAKLRAASDVRKVVRDTIGIKNPEFKDKMFDLASLYDVKDTAIRKLDQLPNSFWETNNGKALKATLKYGSVGVAGATLGGEAIKHLVP